MQLLSAGIWTRCPGGGVFLCMSKAGGSLPLHGIATASGFEEIPQLSHVVSWMLALASSKWVEPPRILLRACSVPRVQSREAIFGGYSAIASVFGAHARPGQRATPFGETAGESQG